MGEYGLDDLEAFAGEILGRCERAMRAAIAKLPDGTYTHSFQTDGLDEPFTYNIAVTVDGRAHHASTTRAPRAQVDRAINCTMTYTFAMTAYALKCALLPNLPNNEGIFRCIEVAAPEGSIVNPRFPAAVGGRMATGHYLPVRRVRRAGSRHARPHHRGLGLAAVEHDPDGRARQRARPTPTCSSSTAAWARPTATTARAPMPGRATSPTFPSS